MSGRYCEESLASKRKRYIWIFILASIGGAILLALCVYGHVWCAKTTIKVKRSEVFERNAKFLAQFGGAGTTNPVSYQKVSGGATVVPKPNPKAIIGRSPNFA